MMNLSTFVKMILKKKNMSNMDLVRAINKVEEASGVKERTVKQNVTNYLNEYFNFGYEFARKIEVALDLKDKTLLNMLPKPRTYDQKKSYNNALKKWKKG